MPTRTKKARKLIDSLPVKKPGKHCNARTPKGYCRNLSGFKTDHKGTGRCYLHGGRAGRDITHGLYSKKLTSTVKDEFNKLRNSTVLVNLENEFALTKALMGNLLSNIENKLSDIDGTNWWVQNTKQGMKISAEAEALMKLLDSMSKLFTKIVDAENKSQENLSVRQIYVIIQQIQINMNSTCGGCPARKTIGNKLKNVKMAEVVSEDTISKNN